MSEYGVDECIDCGQMTDCLLPPRFPHICSRCLFPPRKPDDEERAESPLELLPETLLERLESFKSPTFRGFIEGRNGLPEKHHRRGRDNG